MIAPLNGLSGAQRSAQLYDGAWSGNLENNQCKPDNCGTNKTEKLTFQHAPRSFKLRVQCSKTGTDFFTACEDDEGEFYS